MGSTEYGLQQGRAECYSLAVSMTWNPCCGTVGFEDEMKPGCGRVEVKEEYKGIWNQ